MVISAIRLDITCNDDDTKAHSNSGTHDTTRSIYGVPARFGCSNFLGRDYDAILPGLFGIPEICRTCLLPIPFSVFILNSRRSGNSTTLRHCSFTYSFMLSRSRVAWSRFRIPTQNVFPESSKRGCLGGISGDLTGRRGGVDGRRYASTDPTPGLLAGSSTFLNPLESMKLIPNNDFTPVYEFGNDLQGELLILVMLSSGGPMKRYR